MWIHLLLAVTPDELLKLAPPPPATVAQANARCPNQEDGAFAKFDAEMKKLGEEAEKRATALAQKAASGAPPSAQDAQAMAPSQDEMQQMMTTQQALEATQTSIARFDALRAAAAEDARKKSTCKEGNSACLPAWLKQLRAAQTAALEAHAKTFVGLWNTAKAAIEKHAKLMAPRAAKLAKSQSPTVQLQVETMGMPTAEGAKKLAEYSAQACVLMTRLEE